MKCPDCGFDCLPEDTECLACGVNLKYALESKEQAKKRSQEANERYEQQQREFRKELGLINDDDEVSIDEELSIDEVDEKQSKSVPEKEEVIDHKILLEKKIECPNCGYENRESQKECSKCGIIFDKFKKSEPVKPESVSPQLEAPNYTESTRIATPVKDKGTVSTKKESLKKDSTPAPAFKKKTENKFLKLFKKNKNVILSAAAVIIVLLIIVPVVSTYLKNSRLEKAEKARIAELKKTYNDFIQNKYEITSKVKEFADKKQFKKAVDLLKKYRIPKLSNKLEPLDNYITETKLFDKAKKIPARQYKENYLIFTELLKLNPDKILYRKKKDFYKKKYASKCNLEAAKYLKNGKGGLNALKKALNLIDKALYLIPGNKKYLKTKRKLLTEKLLFFEGNNKIQMAVRNDGLGRKIYRGQRKLTIWIKNISNEPVYINVQYFTMIGKNKHKYSYNDVGKRVTGKLMPGQETVGELYFRTRTAPAEIIFSHLVCGTISRVFP